MIHQLVNSPEWAKTDTSSVEATASGAAFLPPELRVKFQSKLEAGFAHGYGLSESVRVSPPLTVLEKFTYLMQTFGVIGSMRENVIPGYKPIDKSLGLLLPSLQARIVREDGTDCGIGEPGEFWVKGGSISQGYLDDERATAETFTQDGWLKTGDIFTVDEKGNY